MRFLLLNQFYPPDPAPTGQYLHDLAQALVERGHEVKVFCSRRSYDGTSSYISREHLAGVEVFRLPATGFGRRGFAGKMADYASYYVSLLMALMLNRQQPDLILSLTTPPFVGLLGKLAAGKYGCRHADWVMDLYPDVMFAHGLARSDGLLFQWLQKLACLQLKGAHAVIALGPQMAGRVTQYAGNRTVRSSVTWLPLWSNPGLAPCSESESSTLRVERGWREGEMVLLYSGNMGLGHRFDEFLEAARLSGTTGPRWVFCGSGKRKVEIEKFARTNPLARIELLNYAPQARLSEHLCSADVHLMSLEPAWQGLMVPSKLQASFAVGRPVLYVGGLNCETAKWIQDSGGGWVVAENDLEALLAAIRQALDPKERRRRGQAARRFAEDRFNQAAICNQLALLLESASPAPVTPVSGSNAVGPAPTSANWSVASGP